MFMENYTGDNSAGVPICERNSRTKFKNETEILDSFYIERICLAAFPFNSALRRAVLELMGQSVQYHCASTKSIFVGQSLNHCFQPKLLKLLRRLLMHNIDFDLFVLFSKTCREGKDVFVLKVFWTVKFLVSCLNQFLTVHSKDRRNFRSSQNFRLPWKIPEI